jgi:hypothetical protein
MLPGEEFFLGKMILRQRVVEGHRSALDGLYDLGLAADCPLFCRFLFNRWIRGVAENVTAPPDGSNVLLSSSGLKKLFRDWETKWSMILSSGSSKPP